MTGHGSPFHSGEHVLQLRAGMRDAVETAGAGSIQNSLGVELQGALKYQRLAFLALASEDGYPICAALAADRGFLDAPAPDCVELRWANVRDRSLEREMTAGCPISLMMMLDLPAGGRLRLNGGVESAQSGVTRIRIAQVFTNGSRFLHDRRVAAREYAAAVTQMQPVREALAPDMEDLLRRADTLIVATRHPALEPAGKQGLDVSHRGGLPGFVDVPDAKTLLWPEYSGNGFFNTAGNLMLDARCCLLAMAGSDRALRVRGRAELLWKDPTLKASVGAERGIRLRVEQAEFVPNELDAVAPLEYYAPDLAGTLPDRQATSRWSAMRIVRKEREAADAMSVYLEAATGQPLLPFLAGQHVRVRLPESSPGGGSVDRDYSLSHYTRTPRHYRLTVKRRQCQIAGGEGAASTRIHDVLDVGSSILASAPKGDFNLPTELSRPLVFVSAGIGITPMVAMLQELAHRAPHHPLWFIHGARNGATWAFRRELATLREHLSNARWWTCFSSPRPDEVLGGDFDAEGRVSLDTLKATLPFDGYDFFLCGPDRFLAHLNTGLRNLGVAPAQIHIESFGMEDDSSPVTDATLQSVLPVVRTVRFNRTGVTAQWTPASGTLLDLALSAGIEAPFSCRTGMCATCSQRLLTGRTAYMRRLSTQPARGHVLLCSAVPASNVDIDL